MSQNTAYIIQFHEVGGRLQLDEVPMRRSALQREGSRHQLGRGPLLGGQVFHQPVVPSKIGMEAAGFVEAVGPGVDASWVGKSVGSVPAFDMTTYGLAGDTAVVPVEVLAEHSKRLSFEQAASIWMSYLTAYGALIQDKKFGKGDFVLLIVACAFM